MVSIAWHLLRHSFLKMKTNDSMIAHRDAKLDRLVQMCSEATGISLSSREG